MELAKAVEWAAGRHYGALVTIRRDGRPQSSDIVYSAIDGMFRVSVTDDRAKTRNLRRDPRAVLHVSDPDKWSYVSLDGTVELSAVASEPGDAICRELGEMVVDVQGREHPDWDEFNKAMVDDRRLVLRFRPTSATGVLRD